jgi:hypothetical protein
VFGTDCAGEQGAEGRIWTCEGWHEGRLDHVGPKLLKLCIGRYEKDQKMWACISVMFNVHEGSE